MKRRRGMALLVAGLIVAAVVLFRHRLQNDFLPLDRSTVGPNLLASLIQWAVVLVVATLLYPPWRRAVERFFGHQTEALHTKLDVLTKHHEDHVIKLDAILAHHEDHIGRMAEIKESLEDLHRKHDALVDNQKK